MTTNAYTAIPENLRSFTNTAFSFTLDIEAEALIHDTYSPGERSGMVRIPGGGAVTFSQLADIVQFRSTYFGKYDSQATITLTGSSWGGSPATWVNISTSDDSAITVQDITNAMRYLRHVCAEIRRISAAHRV